jgi:hypothetical protein
MKRNISLFVLFVEIAAIVVLHAIKMNQSPVQNQGGNLSSVNVPAAEVKSYPLLSIK